MRIRNFFFGKFELMLEIAQYQYLSNWTDAGQKKTSFDRNNGNKKKKKKKNLQIAGDA